jgi:hypothetical protein
MTVKNQDLCPECGGELLGTPLSAWGTIVLGCVLCDEYYYQEPESERLVSIIENRENQKGISSNRISQALL